MSFIFNRGTIIFITCSIVSLVPISLASAMVVLANTFTHPTSISVVSSWSSHILYIAPLFVFLMGDFLFYQTVVKHQEISSHEKAEAVAGFFLGFIVIYIIYFISIDLVTGFIHVLTKV